jgi:alpha-2-macroglobulin
MKTRNWLLAGIAFAAILIIVILNIKKPSSALSEPFEPVNPAFGQYISAFTGGLVSSRSNVQVVLAFEYADSAMLGQEVSGLFDFQPNIKGTSYWKDSRTIEFRPEKPLAQGERYEASFNLKQLIDVPDSLDNLDFGFQVIKQDVKVTVGNLMNYAWEESRWKYLEGKVALADAVDSSALKELLDVEYLGKNMPVRWVKLGDREYMFIVDSLERQEKSREISLRWDGKAIGVKKNDKAGIEMPPLGHFRVSKTAIELGSEECIIVEFSDALQSNQELRGLISMGNTSLTYSIDRNIVRVFYGTLAAGEYSLVVSPGIKNWDNSPLPKQSIHKIKIEDLKPALRKVGDGVILPSTEGLIYPFEAVNLRSVDIKIIRIYEKSVPQFLQNNELSENQDLQRVGKLLIKKTIELGQDGKTNLSQWNRFGIDISKLVKVEPGAIYRISLGFNRSQSTYPCQDNNDDQGTIETADYDGYEEDYYDDYGDYGYWDYGNSFFSYDDYRDAGSNYYTNYRWADRENPCRDSYYYSKGLSQNILASDIGMTVKKFSDGGLSFLVSNLVSSFPVASATIKLLDYQLQTLTEIKTDANGFANVDNPGRVFLAMAKSGNHHCYLPLWEGRSLSMSSFDIEGEKPSNGVKGYIYAERGVWRPGDTIFVNFMLEDKDKIIPAGFPLVAELYNARGRMIRKQINKTPVGGIYSFAFPTAAAEQTGTFRVMMKIGGSTFSKTLKVETIKPNRLKINLNIKDNRIDLVNRTPIDLRVDWLHGAVGKDLKADMVVSIRPDPAAFEKSHKGFIFQNQFTTFEAEAIKIAEGSTDDQGKLQFVPEMELHEAPGVLRASITTKVYEKGGGFSIHYSNAQIHPYSSYAGIKIPEGSGWWQESLETGKEHVFTIADVDQSGKAKKDARVELKVYRSEWYWWWHQESGNLANFLSRPGTTLYLTKNLRLSSGTGTFKFKVREQEYGSYVFIVRDLESGHSTAATVYLYWPGAPSQEKREGASILNLASDKTIYQAGETVKVSVPSKAGGKILWSIETSSRQIHHEIAASAEGSTTLEFKADKAMAPNVYVYATLLNPHAETAKGLPLRMYGVIPVMIEDAATRLKPQITMPEEIRPESKVNIKVNETNGKAMSYTLAIVDEGLLDLTSFKTPDPWNYFYAKEALGVRTWDNYDQVIGASGGKFENTISIGGGDDGPMGEKGSPRANRFKPMVIHLGPFTLKAGSSATHQVKIPKYIGSVRVMVVARNDNAYGSSDKTVKVNSPLMVMGSLPRVAGPGEEIALPVTIFAMKEDVKNVQVAISANNLFEVIGQSKQTLKFNRPGEAVINFTLRCLSSIGIGKVQISAISGTHKSTYDVEMDVRSANPMITRTETRVLEAGETVELNIEPFGLAGTNSGMVQLSGLPAMDLEKRLQYLIRYPHGCLEQTVSAAFPQLYLSNLMNLTPEEEADISRNINAAISKLNSIYSREDGSFSYWPGSNYINEWGTSYAGHFLLEAKLKGYSVPEKLVRDWARYQKEIARRFSLYDRYYYSYPDLMQAYRLYTLALAGQPELGLMNKLRENPNLSLQARWRLAAAYAAAGRSSIAREMIVKAATTISPYSEMSYTFGSGERDIAMILETLVLLNEKETAAKLVFSMARDLASGRWYSTQSTAFSLISISKYFGKMSSAKGMTFEISYGDGAARKIASTRDITRERLSAPKKLKAGKLRIKNMGSNTLYLEVFVEGQPVAGNEKQFASHLNMDVQYTDLEGNRINPAKISQGTDFYAIVSIGHPGVLGPYKEMALSQIFPSGWEIINKRMEYDEYFEFQFDHQDIRDDRVLTYFGLQKGHETVVKVQLNAAYKGRFYMPGVACEAMYDKSVSAGTKGAWVEVTD